MTRSAPRAADRSRKSPPIASRAARPAPARRAARAAATGGQVEERRLQPRAARPAAAARKAPSPPPTSSRQRCVAAGRRRGSLPRSVPAMWPSVRSRRPPALRHRLAGAPARRTARTVRARVVLPFAAAARRDQPGRVEQRRGGSTMAAIPGLPQHRGGPKSPRPARCIASRPVAAPRPRRSSRERTAAQTAGHGETPAPAAARAARRSRRAGHRRPAPASRRIPP